MIQDYENSDLSVRSVGDVVVVRFKMENLSSPGEVDRVRNDVDGLLAQGALKLAVDFHDVKFAGSQLLGLLLGLRQQLTQKHGRMILTHTNRIGQLLIASRTSKLFEIAAEPEDAIKSFGV